MNSIFKSVFGQNWRAIQARIANDPVLSMATLFAFALPIQMNFATWIMWFWAAALVFTKSLRWNNRVRRIILPLSLVYSTYLLGSLTDFSGSLPFLGRRLPLLLVVLLIAMSNLNSKAIKQLLTGFIYGVVCAGVLCLLMAVWNSLNWGKDGLVFQANVLEGKAFFESVLYGGNYFFGIHLSFLHQTVYFGLYVLAASAHLLFDQGLLFSNKRKRVLLVFFFFLLLLISNKGALLGMILLVLAYMGYRLQRTQLLVAVVVLIGLCFALIQWNPRLNQALDDFSKKGFVLNPNAQYGFYTRLLSWDSALELIRKEPIRGYGLAHSQEELNRIYEEKEYVHPARQRLNAHSLWFQLHLDNGIFGLISALVLFAVLFRSTWPLEASTRAFFWVVLILLLQSFLEALWNRFSGSSFTAFYTGLVLSNWFLKRTSG